MWGWFGGSGSAQARKDAPKKAILALRQQLDMLQKREKHLENQMAEQDAIARKNVSANKTGKLPLSLDTARLGMEQYSGSLLLGRTWDRVTRLRGLRRAGVRRSLCEYANNTIRPATIMEDGG